MVDQTERSKVHPTVPPRDVPMVDLTERLMAVAMGQQTARPKVHPTVPPRDAPMVDQTERLMAVAMGQQTARSWLAAWSKAVPHKAPELPG